MRARPERPTRLGLRRAARAILFRSLAACDAKRLVSNALRVRNGALRCDRFRYRFGAGRVVLLAAGKAAAAMAAGAEAELGAWLHRGLAVSPSKPAEPLRRTRSIRAAHPLPDESSLRAARAVERLVKGLGPRDLLLVLLSGGASSLLAAPAPGITLADKRAVTRGLMRAGATIGEINAVRKHLSRLKGGGLARCAGQARILGLVLSDDVDDDPSTIASGPLSPDPTTFREVLDILTARRVRPPQRVRRLLERGRRGGVAETPKPGDPVFARTRVKIIGGNRLAVAAAVREARRLGFAVQAAASPLRGEARAAGPRLVARMKAWRAGRATRRPLCLVAGGETTVTVRGRGRGGRLLELLTASSAPLSRLGGRAVMAALATDGVDGNSCAAGGYVDGETLQRARKMGLQTPAWYLAQNDTASFLGGLGDLLVLGPTGTNLLDVVLVCAQGRDRL